METSNLYAPLLSHQLEQAPPAINRVLMPGTAYAKGRTHANNRINAIHVSYKRTECCWRCGQRGHSRHDCKNAARLFCSWCGKKDTYSRECVCPKPDHVFRTQAPGNTNAASPNWITAPALTPSTESQPGTSEKNLNHLEDVQTRDSRLFVKVQIGDQMYYGLIDSGAISSFISKEPLKEMKEKGLAEVINSTLRVSVADGRRTSIIGQVRCPVWVENTQYTLTFHIIPTLNIPVLLGVDALRTINCRMDFGTMTSSINSMRDAPNDLTEDQARETIQKELLEFENVHGPTPLTQHEIRVKPNQEPIKFCYTSCNPAIQQIIYDEVAKMLEAGLIEPSSSPWRSSVIIVEKNNKYRFCIDFRKVNEVTERGTYPLSQVSGSDKDQPVPIGSTVTTPGPSGAPKGAGSNRTRRRNARRQQHYRVKGNTLWRITKQLGGWKYYEVSNAICKSYRDHGSNLVNAVKKNK